MDEETDAIFGQLFSDDLFETKPEKLDSKNCHIERELSTIIKRDKQLNNNSTVTSQAYIFFILLFAMIGFLIYTMSISTLVSPVKIVKAKSPQPFFPISANAIVADHYYGTLNFSRNRVPGGLVVMYYSPWSINAKLFRNTYLDVAKNVLLVNKKRAPKFVAVNCFHSQGDCRKKFKITKFPIIAAYRSTAASYFNGPLTQRHLSRWVNRLQHFAQRVSTYDQLDVLRKKYDLLAIAYIPFESMNLHPISFTNFTAAAYQFYNGDPNSESTEFCVVTNANLANKLGLYSPGDVVLMNNDGEFVKRVPASTWIVESLVNTVTYYAAVERIRSVAFLNTPSTSLSSTIFGEYLKRSSLFLVLSPNILYGSDDYFTVFQAARDYTNCDKADDDYVSAKDIEDEKIPVITASGHMKRYSCQKNYTMQFLVIDPNIQSHFCSKWELGPEETAIIAVNSELEMTKTIRNVTLTRDTIFSLVQQHHEPADHENVVESHSLLSAKPKHRSGLQRKKVVNGERPELIKKLNNMSDLTTTKDAFLFVSGGSWHSASISVLGKILRVAHYFSPYKRLIDFYMVETAHTVIPYNFNFVDLPKLLMLRRGSVSASMAYPDDLPITYTNIISFIFGGCSQPLRISAAIHNCNASCTARNQYQLRSEKKRLRQRMRRTKPAHRNKMHLVQLQTISRVLITWS